MKNKYYSYSNINLLIQGEIIQNHLHFYLLFLFFIVHELLFRHLSLVQLFHELRFLLHRGFLFFKFFNKIT